MQAHICSFERSHYSVLLTLITGALYCFRFINQLVQPYNIWNEVGFLVLVLLNTVNFPLLFSWLAAFYKMLSVLTSKLRASWIIAVSLHTAPPTRPALRGTVSWREPELKAGAALVSHLASVSNISARTLLTAESSWQRERRHPSNSEFCVKWRMTVVLCCDGVCLAC